MGNLETSTGDQSAGSALRYVVERLAHCRPTICNSCRSSLLPSLADSVLQPNAQTYLPPEAAATQERRLEAVRCSAVLGGIRRRAGNTKPPAKKPTDAIQKERGAKRQREGAKHVTKVPQHA